MTTNPLAGRGKMQPCRVTYEQLCEYAQDMNRKRFVRDSGSLYFVNKRVDDETGEIEHFLDRAA